MIRPGTRSQAEEMRSRKETEGRTDGDANRSEERQGNDGPDVDLEVDVASEHDRAQGEGWVKIRSSRGRQRRTLEGLVGDDGENDGEGIGSRLEGADYKTLEEAVNEEGAEEKEDGDDGGHVVLAHLLHAVVILLLLLLLAVGMRGRVL